MVNLIAPINQLGYGVVGYNVLRGLMKSGIGPSYFPIGEPKWESDLSFVNEAVNRAKTFDFKAPSIRIWHQHDMAMFPGRGPRIGWPIFELDKFSEVELHHLSSVDRLFVCSQWAKDVVKDHLPDMEVDVIPLGVDRDVFNVSEEARRHRAYWTTDKVVFINVGKWEVRKGHNELLEAFNKAFTPEDEVELWMLNTNPFIGARNETWKTKYLASPMGESIRMLPRVNSQKELAVIFNTVDWGVFPAHAEGWNLEPLELMACGIPSVVTNYSGHTEYCDAANSLLVEPTGMEAAQDGVWFHGQGDWCSFDVEELAEKMRQAYTLKRDQKERYDQLCEGALVTADKFSWDNTISCITESLGVGVA